MNENDSPSSGTPAAPTAGPPQQPPSPPSNDDPSVTRSAPRRLYRAPDGMLGGVARGLAAYFDIDPVITRLLFLVALISGIGLPAYLVCWIVIPKAQTWPTPEYADPATTHTGQSHLGQVTSGLLVVALAVLVGTGLDGAGQFVLPAVLLGFGVYLLSQRGSDDTAVAHADTRGEGQGSAMEDILQAATAQASNRVTPTVLSILALGLGCALALQAAGVAQLAITALAAAGLVIVAIGLLASVRLGPAPGLIPTGLALAMVLVGTSAAAPWAARLKAGDMQGFESQDDSGLETLLGDQEHAPKALSQLQPEYKQVVGRLRLDLTDLELAGETRQVDLSIALGELEVVLPPDVSAEVNGRVGIGEAHAFDQTGGVVQRDHLVEDAGKVVINFKVGIGEGTVRHAQ